MIGRVSRRVDGCERRPVDLEDLLVLNGHKLYVCRKREFLLVLSWKLVHFGPFLKRRAMLAIASGCLLQRARSYVTRLECFSHSADVIVMPVSEDDGTQPEAVEVERLLQV